MSLRGRFLRPKQSHILGVRLLQSYLLRNDVLSLMPTLCTDTNYSIEQLISRQMATFKIKKLPTEYLPTKLTNRY
jgi:hypothetical protein